MPGAAAAGASVPPGPGEFPPQDPSGCVFTTGITSRTDLQTQLAGGSKGVFAIAYSIGGLEESGDIFVQRFEDNVWSSVEIPIGVGFTPDLMLDAEDQTHVSWCDEGGLTNYQFNGGSTENISSPTCIGRPEMGLDNDGVPHLEAHLRRRRTGRAGRRVGSVRIRRPRRFRAPRIRFPRLRLRRRK